LVAEDVANVIPDLVVRDKEGKPYSVRYDQVNAMLLNEFLKEHQKVQELERQIEKLTAALQKVSDRLELSKAPPQVVNNPSAGYSQSAVTLYRVAAFVSRGAMIV
jgi:hypothetical protein